MFSAKTLPSLDEYDELADVRAFHVKYGLLVNNEPVHLTTRKAMERLQFLAEELGELSVAVQDQDLAQMCDALVDLVYVAKGTAVMLGVPWEDLWNEVHRTNMKKVRGVTHRGHAVDVKKPEGWKPPNLIRILHDHDYDEYVWLNKKLKFDEQEGHDDPV